MKLNTYVLMERAVDEMIYDAISTTAPGALSADEVEDISRKVFDELAGLLCFPPQTVQLNEVRAQLIIRHGAKR